MKSDLWSFCRLELVAPALLLFCPFLSNRLQDCCHVSSSPKLHSASASVTLTAAPTDEKQLCPDIRELRGDAGSRTKHTVTQCSNKQFLSNLENVSSQSYILQSIVSFTAEHLLIFSSALMYWLMHMTQKHV